MDRSVAWVAVSKVVGRPRLLRLVQHVGDAGRAFRLATESLGPARREQLLEEAERDWRGIASIGGRLVLYTDPEFPDGLRAIDNPPAMLYCAGPLSLRCDPAIAVVGSRRSSPYGQRVAFRMAADLASVGVTVVSGLAMGVDQSAHRGALAAGGPTVAVLGTGLDVPYPASSEKVYWMILERGLLVSELPPGTPALPWNFPERNRLITGLSRAVVVVEAAERSGTKTTVDWAERQHRLVCAVPGPVTSPLSVGPHRLLLEGATMVTCAGDVLFACGLVDVPPPRNGAHAAGARAGGREAAEAGDPGPRGAPGQGGGFRQDEARVLEALEKASGDAGEVAAMCGLPVERVLAALGFLEVQGWVRRWPDGTFHRIETAGRG